MTHETNNEQVRKLRDEIIADRLSYKPALLDRAIERFADSLEEAGRWMPIESEPNDHMPRLYLVRQKVVQGFVDVTGTRCVQHELGWRVMRGKPSHWQPLPPAPNSQKDR